MLVKTIILLKVRQWNIFLSFESTLQCWAVKKIQKVEPKVTIREFILFLPNVLFCYHSIRPLHMVQCADCILKDEYNDHFIYYFMEYLNVSDSFAWMFCNRFKQLCGEIEFMYTLSLAPWRAVQPVMDGFTTTHSVWFAATVYRYIIWNVLPWMRMSKTIW